MNIHEETLKIARNLIEKDPSLTDWVISKFPELKESEDELTWLTKYIEEEVYSLSMNIRDDEDRIKLKNLQKSLAWLEKQGEQKPYGQRKECVDCQFNYAGECKGSCAMKRGKQKPDNGFFDFVSNQKQGD